MAARLAELNLPDFGDPVAEPVLSETIYAERLDRITTRLSARKIDALIVYGDREHAANIAYASGYDPRFEEAILVIVPGRRPHLMVGNEGWGYAALAKGQFERVLYQPFSLMGQPRDRLVPIQDLLRKAGVEKGMTIGTAGWKGFDLGDGEIDPKWLEIPNFIAGRSARALRREAGDERIRGGAADAAQRPAALGPSDALRRGARPIRASQPVSAKARTRRSLHGRVRPCRRAQLPCRVLGRECRRPARRHRRLCGQTRCPFLRGGRELVRGA
jgi:hypothetical protein